MPLDHSDRGALLCVLIMKLSTVTYNCMLQHDRCWERRFTVTVVVQLFKVRTHRQGKACGGLKGNVARCIALDPRLWLACRGDLAFNGHPLCAALAGFDIQPEEWCKAIDLANPLRIIM